MGSQAARPGMAEAVRSNGDAPPLVDYHTHLNSLMYSEANTPPILPTVRLPDDFAMLLRERSAIATPDVLARSYTDDALFLDWRGPNWARGREKIALLLGLVGSGGYNFVPMAFSEGDSVGYIAGVITRGEGASLSYKRSFHLSVVKKGARWFIAAESWSNAPPPIPHADTGEQLIAELDAGHIREAVVLSPAFVFGSGLGSIENEYARVQEENDWIAQQVASHPGRLIGFCSFNPLRNYAVEELERCAKNPNLVGLKLHFSDSAVDLRNPEHLSKIRTIFRVANGHHMPITVHLATLEQDYDARAQAAAFLNSVLPEAPDSIIQIAHMTGDTGFTNDTDASFEIFARAIKSNDRRTRNLYFDAAGVVLAGSNGQSEVTLALIAKRMREVGLNRILFGSDRHAPNNEPPADAWKTFHRLPLTNVEFGIIAHNLLPYTHLH